MKNFIIIILALFISCTPGKEQETGNQSTVAENEGIRLSEEQLAYAKIKTVVPEKKKIAEQIACTGILDVLPGGKASVSPLMGGYIQQLHFLPGEKIEKGAVLATLTHPDFIDLQKQYIEAKSQMDFLSEEYKRQGELTVENAASLKNMQRAKADYLSAEATYKSLKSQLGIMGVDVQKIEKGDFIQSFQIKAPISGIISELNVNTGQYLSPDNYAFEIMNIQKLYVKLDIFEKDMEKIGIGQKIICNTTANTKTFTTNLKRIDTKLDETTRTLKIFGELENNNGSLKPGMYVNANVLVNEKESLVVPAEAILKDTESSYLFIQKNGTFFKIIIKTGLHTDDFVEIVSSDTKLEESNVVSSGAYYLASILELGE